jgi:hypothetical protein
MDLPQLTAPFFHVPHPGMPQKARGDAAPSPAARSVEAIRSAYGRTLRSARSSADRGVTAAAAAAAAARDSLMQRGERLRGMQERSTALESEAANFGDLAAELNRQQKWWL